MFRRHKRSAKAKEEEEGKEGIPNFSGLDEDQEWKSHTRRSLRPFFELRTHQVRLLLPARNLLFVNTFVH
jgi:hypothetical protein